MNKNLDLNLLRTFAAVAERGSMTAAANTLHMTQGAVSQQIKRLEELFGAALFDRDRRGLRITGPGERLLGKASQLLSLNDEIWTDMITSPVAGKVRLGAPYDLVGALTPIFKAFAQDYPQVDIALNCAASPDLMDALKNGELDLALVEQPVNESSGECLSVERLVWVGARAGSAYLKQPLPVSMVAHTCAFHPAVLSALHRHGRNWRTVFENGSLDATTAAVRADMAVTAWLAITVPTDVQILGPDSGLPQLPPFAITLHTLPNDGSGAVSEMARFIREGMRR